MADDAKKEAMDLAVIFGKPKGGEMPKKKSYDDDTDKYADLAAQAFPDTKVDVDALKELIMQCMDSE